MNKPKLDTLTELTLGLTLGPWAAERFMDLFRSENNLSGMDPASLENEVERERAESEVLQAKARAAFEFALASRIMTAAEVRVEEYYDTTGSGGVGVDLNEGRLGAHGNGSRVSHRIIHMSGWPNAVPEQHPTAPVGQASADPTLK
jgi:hypothetical protein